MKGTNRRLKRSDAVQLPQWTPGPILRELVSVHVDLADGSYFNARLTRVPGLGEEIVVENRSYQITRVQHATVDNDGRAELGYHAWLEAVLKSED